LEGDIILLWKTRTRVQEGTNLSKQEKQKRYLGGGKIVILNEQHKGKLIETVSDGSGEIQCKQKNPSPRKDNLKGKEECSNKKTGKSNGWVGVHVVGHFGESILP